MRSRLSSWLITAVIAAVSANAETNQRLSAPIVFRSVAPPLRSGQYLANIGGTVIRVRRTSIEAVVPTDGDPLHISRVRKNRILLTFLGTSDDSELVPSDSQPSESNFYYGRDPGKWLIGVPGYRTLLVKNLYPGIDLQYRVVANEIEYDFVVRPGSNPAQIREWIRGDSTAISDSGDVVSGPLIQRRPNVYQKIDGRNRSVRGDFRLTAKNVVEFRIGRYDRSRSLIIDPEIAFASYLGGSNADYGHSVAVDAISEPHVAGFTLSRDFPVTSNAMQTTKAPGGTYGADAFATKLTADGSSLIFSTYIGGSEDDSAYNVAVGSSGQVYVSGATESPDFPLTLPPAVDASAGNPQGFLVQLAGSSGRLVSSQLLAFLPVAMHYDPSSNTLLLTDGTNVYRVSIPSVSTIYQEKYQIGYNDLATDPAGGVCLVGSTSARGIPTSPGAYQSEFNGGSSDAFITHLDASGNTEFKTYLGGSDDDEGYSVASDTDGSCTAVGLTASNDFPQTVSLGSLGSGLTTFVAKFGPSGGLQYASYLSNPSNAREPQIAIDGTGSAWITPCDFFGSQNYVYRIPRDGQQLTESDLLPFAAACNAGFFSSLGDVSRLSLTADSTGALYVTGSSASIPATPGAFQTNYAGTGGPAGLPLGIGDAFVIKILPPPSVSFVASAATGSSPFAAEQIISIYGARLGPSAGSGLELGPGGVVTTSNSDVEVLFDGIPAPIIYASASQVNAVIPCEVSGHSSTQMVVQYSEAQSPPFTVVLSPAAPGIFTADGSGQGQAAALNQDNSFNSPSNPAPRGSILTFYATGVGATSPCADGQVYQSDFPTIPLPVVVGVGGSGAHVDYAGQAPDLVSGVAQFNIVIPSDATTGVVRLTLKVGGIFSKEGVTIAVN
jgi:uncharacterized protein (TIGR03437 family)